MGSSSEAAQKRETMTTGEAAQLLRNLGVEGEKGGPMDAQAVRRLCEYGLIEFGWTRADAVRKDRNGRDLRGHRKVFKDSVEDYAKRRVVPAPVPESSPSHS